MRSTHLVRLAAAAIVASALTMTACGGDDDNGGAEASNTANDAAAASGDAPAAGDNVITIAGSAFGGVQTVPAGTQITVVNNDSAPHTFTADDGAFDSGAIQPGDSFEITLSSAGTVAFHCDFHSSMTGSITVTA